MVLKLSMSAERRWRGTRISIIASSQWVTEARYGLTCCLSMGSGRDAIRIERNGLIQPPT